MKSGKNNLILVGVIAVITLVVIIKVNNTRTFSNPIISPSTQTPIKKPSIEEISQAPSNSSYPESATETPITNQTDINTCPDGELVRQNVKPCSPELECYSLTPMSERYCRMPDGTCKFFCTDK